MRSRRAFTLIEVITTAVIVALMGSFALPAYLDYRTDALRAAEKQTAAAVQTGIYNKHANDQIQSSAAWPSSLDAAPTGAAASPATPLFTAALNSPVTEGWRTGSSTNTYLGPTGATYYYDPQTGRFSTDAPTPPAAPPVQYAQLSDFFNQQTFTVGQDQNGQWYGSGYVANPDGTVSLNVSSSNWQSRALVQTVDMPSAGDYSFDVNYQLTDYWTQLHYWEVIGVSDGMQMDLTSYSNMLWDFNEANTQIIYREYSRPGQDGGQWVKQANTFTVTQDMTTKYSHLLFIMVASQNPGQEANWGNVTGNVPGLAPGK